MMMSQPKCHVGVGATFLLASTAACGPKLWSLHACGDFFSEPDWDNTTFRVELFAESLWQEQNPKRRF
jgi:hypothetical protein